MVVAGPSCPHGESRGGQSSTDNFQFVNLTDSSKLDDYSRTLVRSRAAWSSNRPPGAVAFDQPDRRKQMGKFRLQQEDLTAIQSQHQSRRQIEVGFRNTHKPLGWKSGPTRPKPKYRDTETQRRRKSNSLLSIHSQSIYQNPANATADPFNTLPISIDSRESVLLQHCEVGFIYFIAGLHSRCLILGELYFLHPHIANPVPNHY